MMISWLPLRAQIDEHLWLSGVTSPGGTQILELDRSGQLVMAHPGPIATSLSVVKEGLFGQVFVVDEVGQRLLTYQSGLGLTAQFTVLDLRAVAVQGSGTVALMTVRSLFDPGVITILGMPGLPTFTTGLDPRRLVAGPGNDLWTVNRLTLDLTLIRGGTATHITPTVLPGTPLDLDVASDGKAFVSFQAAPDLISIDPQTLVQQVWTFPETVIGFAVDADRSVLVLGQMGGIYRLDRLTGSFSQTGTLPQGTFGQPFLDPKGGFWLEDVVAGRLLRVDWAGTVSSTTVLPVGTRTLGDPLGYGFVSAAERGGDADLDGVSSNEEFLRGSDPIDSASVPPGLAWIWSGGSGILDVELVAPGFEGMTYAMTFGLEPKGNLGLGAFQGAPYFGVGLDALAWAVLSDVPLPGVLPSNFPFGTIDANGLGRATLNLDAGVLPASLPPLYFGAAVISTIPGTVASVTTDRVRFDWPVLP